MPSNTSLCLQVLSALTRWVNALRALQVVRAGRDIPAGSEVTLSYLGPQLFAPGIERQAELQQQWGFDCNCSRWGWAGGRIIYPSYFNMFIGMFAG